MKPESSRCYRSVHDMCFVVGLERKATRLGTTKTPWRLLSFTGDDVVVSRVPGRMPCMLKRGASPKREGFLKRRRSWQPITQLRAQLYFHAQTIHFGLLSCCY